MPFDMRHLTVEQIRASVDIPTAIQVYQETWAVAPVSSLTPWPHGNPPLGTWRLDPTFGDFDVLVDIPTEEVCEGEPEDYIRNHRTYHAYLEWARAGLEAPAVNVVRHIRGHLVCSSGRRRRLAAIDAGLPFLRAWFSETNERGGPLWHADDLSTVYSTRAKLLEAAGRPDLI
ncbi:MAG: hypothetical protein KJ077_10870 [Anaerolineae bacterium]|nr:hypothetical protein [Anaerolineae bacterium]